MSVQRQKPTIRNDRFLKRDLIASTPNEVMVRALLYGYQDLNHPENAQKDVEGGNRLLLDFVATLAAGHGSKKDLQSIQAWLSARDPQTGKTIFTMINERNQRKPAIMLSSKGKQKLIATLEGTEIPIDQRELTKEELHNEITNAFKLRQLERVTGSSEA